MPHPEKMENIMKMKMKRKGCLIKMLDKDM